MKAKHSRIYTHDNDIYKQTVDSARSKNSSDILNLRMIVKTAEPGKRVQFQSRQKQSNRDIYFQTNSPNLNYKHNTTNVSVEFSQQRTSQFTRQGTKETPTLKNMKSLGQPRLATKSSAKSMIKVSTQKPKPKPVKHECNSPTKPNINRNMLKQLEKRLASQNKYRENILNNSDFFKRNTKHFLDFSRDLSSSPGPATSFNNSIRTSIGRKEKQVH